MLDAPLRLVGEEADKKAGGGAVGQFMERNLNAGPQSGGAGDTFVNKGKADNNFVIVVVGSNSFPELVCMLRAILSHPFIGHNTVTVLVECEPPEQLVEMYRSMGVVFYCGVLEREMNLIQCGIHEADYIILLNGQEYDENSYLEQDRGN